MAYPKGQHPGATWKKCDFQCHTPRDIAWRGGPDLPGGTEELEAKRTEWAAGFISACSQRGLSIVGVTDHHDAVMLGYVRNAPNKSESDVTVFPGLEITCKDNAQCLAILDPSSSPQAIQKLLHMLNGVMPAAETSAKTDEVPFVNMTVEELFSAVEGEGILEGIILLLPHFSDEDAHKSLNEKGHHPRFMQLECDGVYVERPYASLSPVTIQKIRGEIPEWGRRRRAILVTGDNRSAGWERLGVNDCWIKLGEMTVEGIRQAFLADEARIAYTHPQIPPERITRLTVQSQLTGPQPLEVTFNEGLTAIIGGRGSGKTSVLEYLRFALGRSERDLPLFETGPIREREARLVDETLSAGFVEVVLDRAGVKETWRRQLNTKDYISATDARGETAQLTLDEARRRFPARAFHQKGLSSTTSDPTSAADQITGIAAAEAVDRRREIDQHIGNTKRKVTTALQQLAGHWQNRFERQQAEKRVSDLKNRLVALAQRLQDEGVSSENIDILKRAPVHSRAEAFFSTAKDDIAASRASIEAMHRSTLIGGETPSAGLLEFPEVKDLSLLFREAEQHLSELFEHAMSTLDELERARLGKSLEFETRYAQFKEVHAVAVAQQTSQKSLVDENTRLTSELQLAEAALARAAAAERSSERATIEFSDAQDDLERLIEQKRGILADAATQVAGKSSEMLRARLKRDSRPTEYIETLCTLFEKSYVSDSQQKCTQWVATLLGDGAQNSWADVRTGILAAYEKKISTGSPKEPGDELSSAIGKLLFDGDEKLTLNQRLRIYNNITDSSVGAILSAVPRDYIILKYVEDGREVPFERASPGQQASALLELLLGQSAGTLIIDQPEDDIDNRIIMKVVGLIRSSKQRRQMIFATHNANIVVNGDADKVIALISGESGDAVIPPTKTIGISSDGSIEANDVCVDITRIMEGGKDAFSLRSRKYHFD